jgi:hypothetical protein
MFTIGERSLLGWFGVQVLCKESAAVRAALASVSPVIGRRDLASRHHMECDVCFDNVVIITPCDDNRSLKHTPSCHPSEADKLPAGRATLGRLPNDSSLAKGFSLRQNVWTL